MTPNSFLNALRHAPGFLRAPVIKLLARRIGQRLELNPAGFAGQRVLILGPARTLSDDLAGLDPTRFDLFIKMNNGLDTPIPALGDAALRCDVLFHSLTDEARPVDHEKLRAANVRLLVHRTATKGAFLHTLIAASHFGPSVAVRHIPHDVYHALGRKLGGASPTTGLVCADFFLSAPVREVAIMGFTLFSTAYLTGYDDTVASDAEAVARIAAKGHHNPLREVALLVDMVGHARRRGVIVTLGKGVTEVLARGGLAQATP